jgi:hypothetical protein
MAGNCQMEAAFLKLAKERLFCYAPFAKGRMEVEISDEQPFTVELFQVRPGKGSAIFFLDLQTHLFFSV